MSVLKPKAYEVLSRAVEEGIESGWRRAHKHVENPSEEAVHTAIYDAVMAQVFEYFDIADASKVEP